MLCKHGENPKEKNNTEARSQQSCFAILLKTYPRTDALPKIRSTSVEHNTFLRENTSGGLLLHIKGLLKDLYYKKFLFTVFKRNILTLKMNKQTNKYIKITSAH